MQMEEKPHSMEICAIDKEEDTISFFASVILYSLINLLNPVKKF